MLCSPKAWGEGRTATRRKSGKRVPSVGKCERPRPLSLNLSGFKDLYLQNEKGCLPQRFSEPPAPSSSAGFSSKPLNKIRFHS